MCPSGQWATQRTTTVCLLQEATKCCPTETPQPASPRPPQAWSASPRWGRLESHQAPLHATNPHQTGVCVCVCLWSFVLRGSPPSLLSSWLNMSHITHDNCVFYAWVWRIRLNNVARSDLQLDVYKHSVSWSKDLLCGWLFLAAWWLITSHPTRKNALFSCHQDVKRKLKFFSAQSNPNIFFRACFGF